MARLSHVPIAAAALLLLLSASPTCAAWDCTPGNIYTVAGGGLGDGYPASDALLDGPSSMALAPDGCLYFTDKSHDRVRKIDERGIITTIAGNGDTGYSGDGGPAIEARLNHPIDVALGPGGAIYIADGLNHRVRKVDAAGVITTVAGDGWTDKEGDGRFAGDGGPAIEASLNWPVGLAVGADGSIYIADYGNHRVRKVGPDAVITTVVGDGWENADGNAGFAGDGGPASEASLFGPEGIALAAEGSLYIADSMNGRIRKVDRAGTITTVAGSFKEDSSGDGGPATEAGLHEPADMALGDDGSLYIADLANHRIRRVDPKGIITTVAGDGHRGYEGRGRLEGDGGPATKASLSFPAGVAVAPDGTLYIADLGNDRVRKVTPRGVITSIAGGYAPGADDGRDAASAIVQSPDSMAVGLDGSIFFIDRGPNTLRKIGPDGVITTLVKNEPQAPDAYRPLTSPGGLAVAPDGSVYVTDLQWSTVRKVSPSGAITDFAGTGEEGFSGDGGPATDAELSSPEAVAVGPDGSVYVADAGNHRIRRVGPDGIITTVAGDGWTEGEGWESAGRFQGDGGPATKASFNGPKGIALGPDGSMFIADVGNGRIRKIDPNGVMTTIGGDGWTEKVTRKVADSEKTYEDYVGRFTGDGGLATEATLFAVTCLVVGPDGSVYLADSRNHRIRKIDGQGIITTVAGIGYPEDQTHCRCAGDGGPALAASLCAPGDVAVGPDGSLYIVDRGNRGIRKICGIAR